MRTPFIWAPRFGRTIPEVLDDVHPGQAIWFDDGRADLVGYSLYGPLPMCGSCRHILLPSARIWELC
jgi:hypothetical protein